MEKSRESKCIIILKTFKYPWRIDFQEWVQEKYIWMSSQNFISYQERAHIHSWISQLTVKNFVKEFNDSASWRTGK